MGVCVHVCVSGSGFVFALCNVCVLVRMYTLLAEPIEFLFNFHGNCIPGW